MQVQTFHDLFTSLQRRLEAFRQATVDNTEFEGVIPFTTIKESLTRQELVRGSAFLKDLESAAKDADKRREAAESIAV